MSDSLSKDCNKLEDELKIYLQDSTKVPDAEFEIESLSHITKVNDPIKTYFNYRDEPSCYEGYYYNCNTVIVSCVKCENILNDIYFGHGYIKLFTWS